MLKEKTQNKTKFLWEDLEFLVAFFGSLELSTIAKKRCLVSEQLYHIY